MTELPLHQFHHGLGAHSTEVNGMEVVDHYGDALSEYAALRDTAGVLDLSLRGRLSVGGTDRQRFLNGQVTNNVKDLKSGEGCYAALVTAKGKMVSDLHIYCLPDELLLDFEPGLTGAVTERLEKFIIADDVQVVNAAQYYGLLSAQGPKSAQVVDQLGFGLSLPQKPFGSASVKDPTLGEVYFMNQPRIGTVGFDLFIPDAALGAVAHKLMAAAKQIGGCACGWRALEMVRIEAGIPRFSVDMDDTNLAPEAGIEERAINYNKGCYIGQEVIARIRTYGQVAKSLRGLLLADDLAELPKRGDKLVRGDKEAGFITSALASPAFRRNIALGYVRREWNEPGTELRVRTQEGESPARIVPLPFRF